MAYLQALAEALKNNPLEVPPLVGYRYAAVLLKAKVPMIVPMDIRFKKISGLGISRELGKEENWGLLKSKPSRGTLSFERGVYSVPTPLQVTHVMEWLEWDAKLLQTDILISLLDDSPIPVPLKAWLATDAYLASLEWGALSAEDNQILIETMAYNYRRLLPLSL